MKCILCCEDGGVNCADSHREPEHLQHMLSLVGGRMVAGLGLMMTVTEEEQYCK